MANRTPDYKRAYCNALNLRFGPHEVVMSLGFLEDPKDPGSVVEEIAAVMTPQTFKVMVANLTVALEEWEKAVGQIPVEPGKMDQVRKTVIDQLSNVVKA